MANIKISELTAAANATGAQEFEVNDGGNSRKVTGDQIDNLVLGTTNGLIARTGTNARAARTLTASTAIIVSNGDGVSGNPTVAADVATDANIHAGAANKLVAAGELYTASAPVTSSGTGNHAFDFNAGRTFARTLTGSSTLTNPTNQAAGQSGIIYIIQDATGGRTLSFGADYKHIGAAPTIDTGANKVNVFSYYVRSATNITLSYLGAQA